MENKNNNERKDSKNVNCIKLINRNQPNKHCHTIDKTVKIKIKKLNHELAVLRPPIISFSFDLAANVGDGCSTLPLSRSLYMVHLVSHLVIFR